MAQTDRWWVTSGQPSTSRQPSGSAARGRGRGGGKTSKRARVEDPFDGGDSDSQSDDEPLHGLWRPAAVLFHVSCARVNK